MEQFDGIGDLRYGQINDLDTMSAQLTQSGIDGLCNAGVTILPQFWLGCPNHNVSGIQMVHPIE